MKYYMILMLSCLANFCGCAKILAVFPFPSQSHYWVFEPLLKKLSENGHELTVISRFPQKTKISNLIDIDLSNELPSSPGRKSVLITENITVMENAKLMWNFGATQICDPVLSHPEVARLVKSDQQFDLIILETFVTDCFLGFVHKFKAPWVSVSSCVAMPWSNDAIAHIDNPSYVPHVLTEFTDRMSIVERLVNAVQLVIMKIGYRIYSDWPCYAIAMKHFGPDLPHFDELRKKLALVLLNSHSAVSTKRPLVPGVKEVGGIHIPADGPPSLPADLKEFLDASKDGVLYFSMGSQINSSTLLPDSLRAILKAFSKLAPRRVLWKCNENEIPSIPKNVKCVRWAPQLSILCHPNVKVFMSHGGLLGTLESVYCGVPILGTPLYGDQNLNLAYAAQEGFALRFKLRGLTEEELSSSLHDLFADNRYSQRAKEASRILRDRPIPPLDEAVFWVEYVLRHGERALRTAASELAWYQYLLLDIVAGILFIAYLTYRVLATFLRCLVCLRSKQKSVAKRKIKSN